MILIDVGLWIDDHVTMTLLVNDPSDMAEVEEKVAKLLEGRFGCEVSHGIIDIDDANRCKCICHDLWPGGCGQMPCSVCGG